MDTLFYRVQKNAIYVHVICMWAWYVHDNHACQPSRPPKLHAKEEALCNGGSDVGWVNDILNVIINGYYAVSSTKSRPKTNLLPGQSETNPLLASSVYRSPFIYPEHVENPEQSRRIEGLFTCEFSMRCAQVICPLFFCPKIFFTRRYFYLPSVWQGGERPKTQIMFS